MGGEQFMKHCEICKRLQYMHIADKECDSCKVDRLRKERDQFKQHLNAALWLLSEYTDLPGQAANGNTAFGIDEGVVQVNDMLKAMGKSLGDVDIFVKAKLYNKSERERDRLQEELDRLQKELKREVNTKIEVQFNYFAEADVWKGTANALASELDKAEKERDRYRELLQRVIEE